MEGFKQMVASAAHHLISILLSGNLPKLLSDLVPVTLAIITARLMTALQPIFFPDSDPSSYTGHAFQVHHCLQIP